MSTQLREKLVALCKLKGAKCNKRRIFFSARGKKRAFKMFYDKMVDSKDPLINCNKDCHEVQKNYHGDSI